MLGRLLRSSRAPGAFVTRHVAKDFNWQRLVTPQTDPAFVSAMKEIDNQFAMLRGEMLGVPKTIEPIDFDSYKKVIQEPGLVDKIRREYEALKFPKVESVDLTDINAEFDAAIAKTSANAEISRAEIDRLEQDLVDAKDEKARFDKIGYFEFLERYPGLAEQLREEWDQGYQLPTDAEDRLGEMDVNDFRRRWKNNQDLNVDLDSLGHLNGKGPVKVGDFVLEEEIKKVIAMEKQMFEGNEVYEKFAAEEAAAEANRKAAAKVAK